MMTSSDLLLVSACLSRDIVATDRGESVDVKGVLADLGTFRVAELRTILSEVVCPADFRYVKSRTKANMLQVIHNRLTARVRAEERVSV